MHFHTEAFTHPSCQLLVFIVFVCVCVSRDSPNAVGEIVSQALWWVEVQGEKT